MHNILKTYKWFGAVLLAGAFVLGGAVLVVPAQGQGINIKIPKLSPVAIKGQIAFNRTCAKCHGLNATGSDKGPPLIHDIYNPGHHGDIAFYRAVKSGSPQHHWRFGNMPPQTSVTEKDVARIIRFIRETQEANGIFYRQHKM